MRRVENYAFGISEDLKPWSNQLSPNQGENRNTGVESPQEKRMRVGEKGREGAFFIKKNTLIWKNGSRRTHFFYPKKCIPSLLNQNTERNALTFSIIPC
jgi:hypothetical protein